MKNCVYLANFLFIALFQSFSIQGFEKNSPVQEKEIIYKRIAELELQKSKLKSLYENALKRTTHETIKNRLKQEYDQKNAILSRKIKGQEYLLETILKQEWWWKAAKIFGTLAMTGFFVYQIFTAPPQLSPATENIVSNSSVDSVLEVNLVPEVDLVPSTDSVPAVDLTINEPEIGSEEKSVLQEKLLIVQNPLITPQLDEEKIISGSNQKKLTPEEIALYELRYKNYRMYAAGTFLTTISGLLALGPIALPIDLVLFALSGAAAEQARYYKNKLLSAAE